MHHERSFQRMAAIIAVLSAPFAFGNTLVMLIAMNFDVDAITNPLAILASGTEAADLWRWSMVLDMLGYYLLIVPLVLLLRQWLGQRSPRWAELFGLCLLWYSLIGAIGAAIHAATLPPLIRAYAEVNAGQQDGIRTVFLAVHDLVLVGLWNILEVLVGGIGWIGMGLLLMQERRILGGVTVLLGLAALVDSLGVITNVEALATTGLMIYIFLAPIWALWLGLDVLRRPVMVEAFTQNTVNRQKQTPGHLETFGT